jgi:hypothetical protein
MQLWISIIPKSKDFCQIDNVPQQHYSSIDFSEATLNGQFSERKDDTCG